MTGGVNDLQNLPPTDQDTGLKVLEQTQTLPLCHENLNSEGGTGKGSQWWLSHQLAALGETATSFWHWDPQKGQRITFPSASHLTPYNPECPSASPTNPCSLKFFSAMFYYLHRFLPDSS